MERVILGRFGHIGGVPRARSASLCNRTLPFERASISRFSRALPVTPPPARGQAATQRCPRLGALV